MTSESAAEQALSPEEARRWTRIGLLSALAMALGYLETFIPIPIPGVKLGLANIAILIALEEGDATGAFCVGIVKVLAAGLLFGNPLTMAFSAAGTLLAFAVMAPLARLRTMHLAMVSVVGALAHELGQLAVAAAVLGTPLVWYSAPVLLVAGCITGALCGIVATRTAVLLAEMDGEDDHPTPHQTNQSPFAASQAGEARRGISSVSTRKHVWGVWFPRVALVVFFLYSLILLHASNAAALLACLILAGIACIAGKTPPRMLAAALRPLALILVITFIAQVASFQQGQVIAELGPVALTAETLWQTGLMCARLLGLTAASIALMSLVGADELVDAVAWLLAPLRRLGLRTDGFALSLQVALAAVPALVQTAQAQMPTWKGQLTRREFWRTTVPAFIADEYRRASR